MKGDANARPSKGRRPRLLACIVLVTGLAVLTVALISTSVGRSTTTAIGPIKPKPATKAQGILPPGNPPANIAPSPNFLSDCSGVTYDDSSGCVTAVLAAIANGRTAESLPAMVLPTDWTQLTAAEQLYVATDLERTVRGMPPLAGMATALDAAALAGAQQSDDPSPPGGFPWTQWGSNWAGAVGNPLEAMYFWMYDDGPGSSNVDCQKAGDPGCWGHRDNVLLNLACQPCDMGTGFDPTGYQGTPSWAELLVDTSGAPQLDFAWSDVLTSHARVPVAAVLTAPMVGMAAAPAGNGYWEVASDGGIFTFGAAGFYGSMGGKPLDKRVVGIATTPAGHGYWEVASDGGIFAFGDAGFYGSMGGKPLDKPIVGIATTPNGGGYWEVASDGGIFAFGDASFYGSMGGHVLDRPVVGIAATPHGGGYWEVASDGGIFAFGNAPYRGSTGGVALVAAVVGMSSPSQSGYWLVAADGGMFSFGVPFYGSTG
jgi:ribosomal protein L24E